VPQVLAIRLQHCDVDGVLLEGLARVRSVGPHGAFAVELGPVDDAVVQGPMLGDVVEVGVQLDDVVAVVEAEQVGAL